MLINPASFLLYISGGVMVYIYIFLLGVGKYRKLVLDSRCWIGTSNGCHPSLRGDLVGGIGFHPLLEAVWVTSQPGVSEVPHPACVPWLKLLGWFLSCLCDILIQTMLCEVLVLNYIPAMTSITSEGGARVLTNESSTPLPGMWQDQSGGEGRVNSL